MPRFHNVMSQFWESQKRDKIKKTYYQKTYYKFKSNKEIARDKVLEFQRNLIYYNIRFIQRKITQLNSIHIKAGLMNIFKLYVYFNCVKVYKALKLFRSKIQFL
ncbi:hypothetical protein V8G54_007794 [Vigna mungo]|uniref:Uncharacterized protein n=1 Tax=Vigna mungo TaxID=3915 RepID=A0AAQ3P4F0_VIGMU